MRGSCVTDDQLVPYVHGGEQVRSVGPHALRKVGRTHGVERERVRSEAMVAA